MTPLTTLHAGPDCAVVFDPEHGHVVFTDCATGASMLVTADRATAERIALAARRGAFRPEVSVEEAELLSGAATN